jgi:hypothetical protein
MLRFVLEVHDDRGDVYDAEPYRHRDEIGAVERAEARAHGTNVMPNETLAYMFALRVQIVRDVAERQALCKFE